MSEAYYKETVRKLVVNVLTPVKDMPVEEGALAIIEASIGAICTGLMIDEETVLEIVRQVIAHRIETRGSRKALTEERKKKRDEDALRAAGKPTMTSSLGDLLKAKAGK